MRQIDEMRLALHRWTGAGIKDIKINKVLAREANVVFEVLLRAQNNKKERYIPHSAL